MKEILASQVRLALETILEWRYVIIIAIKVGTWDYTWMKVYYYHHSWGWHLRFLIIILKWMNSNPLARETKYLSKHATKKHATKTCPRTFLGHIFPPISAVVIRHLNRYCTNNCIDLSQVLWRGSLVLLFLLLVLQHQVHTPLLAAAVFADAPKLTRPWLGRDKSKQPPIKQSPGQIY